jgi:two-component system, cell cycle sensor histidine kinase and response regulator CckA
LSRIFDPFFSTKTKGHGLGLSATMGIIRTHQGGLQVQSHPGRGTTFTILLPTLEFEPTQPQTVLSSEAREQGQRQTILVIDDDDAIREVAGDILVDQGFTVATAASGYEGIEQFSRLQSQIGVVLLDMKMPGMNGKETYAHLQKIEPDLKVIFTSGYSEEEVTGQIDNGCPLPFLAKPYSAERLIQQIQQTLQT